MASFAHVAVGVAGARAAGVSDGGRARIGWALLFSFVALAADLDVIAFALGIPYEAPFGHRGASHSIVAALALTAALLPFHSKLRTKRAALFLFLTAISHGLLDSLTDGGLGIGLLWPFSEARYFAPWRPIEVAPIGLGMLSERGLRVVLQELAITSPLLAYAFWPRR